MSLFAVPACARAVRAALIALLGALLVMAAPTAGTAQNSAPEGGLSLQPGDVVRIEIWREPDLSGEFVVNPQGLVVLPLLGEQRVGNLAIEQVREVLTEEYRHHLRNPSINIVPLRRIHLLGEVHRPGLYQVDPTVSLAAAVALAGGATPSGDLHRIRIVRGGETTSERVSVTSGIAAADIRSGDQIFVDRRSWFERNSTFLISVGLSVPSVIAGILALVNR